LNHLHVATKVMLINNYKSLFWLF